MAPRRQVERATLVRDGVWRCLEGSSFLAAFIGSGLLLLAVVVWRGFKVERRKLALMHAEQQLSIERGVPLPDGEVARCTALGWIGATIPAMALGSGVSATSLIVQSPMGESGVLGLVALWMACGATAAGGVIAVVRPVAERAGWALLSRLQVTLEPVEIASHGIQQQTGLLDAMRRPRIDGHPRRAALTF